MEKQRGNYIKILLIDRGREFESNEFNAFSENQGIHRQLTKSYTLEQNGVAECKNRTIVEMTRRVLKAKNLLNNL